jgi:hypothetical protein
MFGVYNTLLPLFLFTLLETVVSYPCVAFDINNNLLVFGLGEKDWNAGTQDNWSSSTGATDITKSGRPAFDGENTTCYLAQFFNAIYVLNGDKSNPSAIYIYDATAKSWSTQSVKAVGFDPTSFNAILDHDTNLFYALSHGEMYTLDMVSMKSANSSAISWNDVEKPPFADGYNPVMAVAQNHIQFLDVPGAAAGQAQIYVIHYNFFQPDLQPYAPSSGGSAFPTIHGQATSFFQETGVQQEFAFIPDDFSGTYVVNVETNTTQVLAPPTSKDTSAIYFASITSLVQLDSTGAVSYLPYKQGDNSANAAAVWSGVKPIAVVVPPGSSRLSPSSSPSLTGSGSGANATGKTVGGQAANGVNQGSQVAGYLVAVFCLVAMTSLL